MTAMRIGQGTHPGRRGRHNEDAYFVSAALGLGIVSDGLGGHPSGEVASAVVVEHVAEQVRLGSPLVAALAGAHRAVLRAPAQGLGVRGMGATAVAARLADGGYQVAWVGDSRAYHWDGRRLRQLTRDHSLVQELLDTGMISAPEARLFPLARVVTQVLGSVVWEVRVDSVEGELGPGECLLLCSDGLTGEVPDAQIARILARAAGPQDAADGLIAAALYNGGSDNVTVLVMAREADDDDQ